MSADSGQRLAEVALNAWVDNRANRWKLVTASYETKKTSGRVDRTYTFERVDRRIAGAPIRAEVGIAGDTPARVRPYVEIPESFRRRYAEMRSWNDLLALFANLGILGVVIIGIVALTRFSRDRRVRWHQPMVVGLVIGMLAFAAGINELSGSWFSYDSAMSPATFQAMQFLFAVLFGVSTALLVGFTRSGGGGHTQRVPAPSRLVEAVAVPRHQRSRLPGWRWLCSRRDRLRLRSDLLSGDSDAVRLVGA